MSLGRLKIAAALVLTSPFVPMLFQGEEWGAATPFLYFTNHPDEKLGEMVRQGRRREFAAQGWDESKIPDPQAPETFARSKLNWAELPQARHAELLAWHKQMIALRRSEPCLRDGRLDCVQTKYDELEKWLVVERPFTTVVCNLGVEARPIPLPSGRRKMIMSSADVTEFDTVTPVLPPDSVAIFKRE